MKKKKIIKALWMIIAIVVSLSMVLLPFLAGGFNF